MLKFILFRKPNIFYSFSTLSEAYPPLSVSNIRKLNVGYNYFRYINPNRKKVLCTLLNSYSEQFKEEEASRDFKSALDLFYNEHLEGVTFSDAIYKEFNLNETILWHLYSIMVLDRTASQYSRFEFMQYDQLMKQLNQIPKHKRNKAKYVFTSHPTQPNSIDQLLALNEVLKGVEENDLEYLDYSMRRFIDANKTRIFQKPSYLKESIAYHSFSLKNLIHAFSIAYELGLKDPADFFERPGTWLTFDFDRHPEMELGLMTYTHGLLINLTIDQYVNIIKEAELEEEMKELLGLFDHVNKYAESLMHTSEKHREQGLSKLEFFQNIPIINIYGIENNIEKMLQSYSETKDLKIHEISKKIQALFRIFRLTGCLGQIRLAGEDLMSEDSVDESILEILREIAILNENCQAADMVIIANFEYQKQYDLVQKLIEKLQIRNIEIVPLLETFASSNDTPSAITMIASSDTRQRDGLLLTELRTLREYKKHPNKYIYMGQGITAERGGGPYKLVHQKYVSLTKCQRERHIRTIQGHYFTSEFLSKDLILTFMLNGGININYGDHFEPSQDYMDFLFELDSVIGVPQREMQKTKEFNDFFVKNKIIKTLVDNFNYAGSREVNKPLENVKSSRAIVQAYINSDRCSFVHPELGYWDRLDEEMIRKMSKYYYDNNRHFKYILYNYGFMISRFDLAFAQEELGYDKQNEIFKVILKGKEALEKILNNLGLSPSSPPMIETFNQHLGLVSTSSSEERQQKLSAYRNLYKIQNYYARKMIKEKTIGVDFQESEKKMKILQSTLANISPFNGKG